ncbi:unnamed protein product [Dibothriocephalus latus]|uniref:Uncharacterized protein n=1 Tax=Dibothriocephalus latus TaxID=60516 RepID=A0A3P6TYK2_DIBLA|nr:unnamed protein product [Dibothriocephalus latus]
MSRHHRTRLTVVIVRGSRATGNYNAAEHACLTMRVPDSTNKMPPDNRRDSGDGNPRVSVHVVGLPIGAQLFNSLWKENRDSDELVTVAHYNGENSLGDVTESNGHW